MANKKIKLDDKYVKSIEGYADTITTIDDPVEVVRKMPGMYIGHIDQRGLLNMIREIYQNSVDQLMRKDSPCNTIYVTFDEASLITIVEDNGMGIPYSKMIKIYTDHNTSGNYTKAKGEYSSGLHGVGSKVTNALSTWMIVESYSAITGDGRRIEFNDGKPTTKDLIKIKNPEGKQGTMVSFKPDENVMGHMPLECETLLTLIRNIMALTNIGDTTIFKCVKKDGSVYEENIVNVDGILSTLIHITKKPVIAPIFVSGDNGTMKADIVFTYDANDLNGDEVISYSNFCPTTLGTHIVGFYEGLGKFFRNYMNNIYLKANSKLKININDIKTGLKAMLSVSHLHPIFSGQAKDELSNEDMRPYVRDLVNDTLENWAKSNPNDLLKVAKHLKDIADIRMKSEEGKVKISNKYKSSAVTGLPSKYTKPNGKKNLELIIVEGDSGAGSAKVGRCKLRQGIFPIKGKIISVLNDSGKNVKAQDILSNDEVAGIINIIGGGYGSNFDISKVKFEKIIFMSDADPDGYHINALLVTFFAVYMLPLIKAGRVYKAVPPLYGMNKGKKSIYFTTKLDYIKYIQNNFVSNNTIQKLNNRTMDKSEITALFHTNIDYTYEMGILSRTFAVDPLLLEMALLNRDKNISAFKKEIIKNFRFIDTIEKYDNSIVIKGLVGGKSQMLILDYRLLNMAKNIIAIMESNAENYYKLNNEICSIYTIMTAFESSNKNAKLSSYKGLGEMDPSQLGDSTLHPDSNRTLIQYTLEDVNDDMKTLRSMQSADGKKKLMRLCDISRQDIIR